MGFILGLIIGGAVGVWAGREITRQKRLRQIEAALHEGRVSIQDKEGASVKADEFNVILDDEFRDA